MARRRAPRSKPVSEKAAGEDSGKGDDVAELLDGAKTPDAVPASPVEAVASGPQEMPGSASDKERRADPKSAPKESQKDLRKLAPKKKQPEEPGYQVQTGASALETVIARGIDAGDTKSIDPVEIFRVTRGGRAMIGGRLCTISTNARVTRLTHDLKQLRMQGIELALIERG
ncbi:MAG TPA: hypothetical protein ENK57_11925 [Polyangiaceae bacterium]|nr:hypothetical protein [Polyangiaceae bacterium]